MVAPTFDSSDARSTRPKVWIDCTDTYARGLHTGIQRVVRNLAHFARHSGENCAPVVQACGQWFELDWDPTISNRAAAQTNDDRGDPRSRWLERLSLVGRNFVTRLRKAFVPRKVGELALDATRCVRWSRQHKRVTFQAGDILLLPDSTWNHLRPPRYRKLRAAGVKVALCVNDILPVTHAHFFPPGAAAQFRRWLDDAAPQVDFFMAISRTVRDELRDYVQTTFPEAGFRDEHFDWYPLGVALEQRDSSGPIRPEVRAAFEDPSGVARLASDMQRGPYLIVSTVEPRKNHRTLLDAFEQVWTHYPQARLCVVGRKGWLVDDVAERIRRHPRHGRQLFWFEDLTDSELAYAYAFSRAFVFPSYAEGYGLPIVEALQCGLPVLASDTSIHREVAGDFARYFDPTRPDELATLIERFESGNSLPPVRSAAHFMPPEWSSSAPILLERCRRMARFIDAQTASVASVTFTNSPDSQRRTASLNVATSESEPSNSAND